MTSHFSGLLPSLATRPPTAENAVNVSSTTALHWPRRVAMDSLPPPGFYRATGSDPLSSTSSTFNPPPQPNVLQLLSPTASYIFSLLPAGLPLVITPPFNAVTDTAPERMQIREINFENEGEYGAHIGDLISHIHTNRIPPGDAFVYKKKMSQSILWLRDFDLKTTFLGSTAYHDIPGVIEYQDQTTVENLANSASVSMLGCPVSESVG